MATIYGTCTGKDGAAYSFYGVYNITNNTTLSVTTYLRRTDGYANSAYNYVQGNNTAFIQVVGQTIQKINAPSTLTIDTRNNQIDTIMSATFIVAQGDTITLTAGFTTVTNSLTGGSLSASIVIPSTTINEPTLFYAASNGSMSKYDGGNIGLSWQASTSTVDGYEIQYSVSDKDTGVFGSWNASTTTTATSYTTLSTMMCGASIKYRIRAYKSTVYSTWLESNSLKRVGTINVKVGTERLNATPWVKVNGEWTRVKSAFGRENSDSEWSEHV